MFALLPFHCRQKLTFATYEHDPQSLFSPPPPGTAVPPHKNRRLIFTTAANEFKLPTTKQADLIIWVIHVKTGEHLVPPPNKMALDYAGLLLSQPCRDADLRKLRDLTSQFAFDEEWQGLQDGWGLNELEKKKPDRDSCRLFWRRRLHPPALPDLLSMGHYLLPDAEQFASPRCSASWPKPPCRC